MITSKGGKKSAKITKKQDILHILSWKDMDKMKVKENWSMKMNI